MAQAEGKEYKADKETPEPYRFWTDMVNEHSEYWDPPAPDGAGERQKQQFIALILASRARLEQLYASPRSDEQKRQGKGAEFARLRSEYHQLRDGQWHGYRHHY